MFKAEWLNPPTNYHHDEPPRRSPPVTASTNHVETTAMSPQVKRESEESLYLPTEQNDSHIQPTPDDPRREFFRRTKSMWAAGVSAVNAYLETEEDYATDADKCAFSAFVDELRSSAEATVSTLQRFYTPLKSIEDVSATLKPTKVTKHVVDFESEDNDDKVDGQACDLDHQVAKLSYRLNQERTKRRRLQDDFESFRVKMVNVLTEHDEEVAEIRAMLDSRLGHEPGSRKAPKKIFGPTNHAVRNIKTDGLDLTAFSWNMSLDKTQLIDPADGFVYLLPDYPDLKAQVLASVNEVAPILLSNRASSSAGLWQCLPSRARGEGGMWRGSYTPPTEACARCVQRGQFCLAFKIGMHPLSATTRLLPLPEAERGDAGFGEEGYFEVGTSRG